MRDTPAKFLTDDVAFPTTRVVDGIQVQLVGPSPGYPTRTIANSRIRVSERPDGLRGYALQTA